MAISCKSQALAHPLTLALPTSSSCVQITNFQKACYRAILDQNRTLLLRGADARTGPSFLNIHMQLRHCCNHPYLIKGVKESDDVIEHR